MMDKYFKMADVFVGVVYPIQISGWKHQDRYVELKRIQEYTAHAINSHDELVELLQAHCKAQDDGAKLVRELDVLLNGEDGAAIQASLCDIVAQVKKHELSFNRVDELVAEVERLRVELKNTENQLIEADEEVQELTRQISELM